MRDARDPEGRVREHHASGVGTTKIPYPIGVRRVPVVGTDLLNPRMLRMTFRGPEIKALHAHHGDDHLKVVFPCEDGVRRDPTPDGEGMLDWPRPRPITRDYTIRSLDDDTLVMDFVLHDGGVASTWAQSVRVGEDVTLAGPPGAKAFPYTHEHYVFAVDATGLPAAARLLEMAPDGLPAHLVVETDEEVEHTYPLPARDRLSVVRLVRDGARSRMAETVFGLDLPSADVFLFAAGEADDIKPLRKWPRERCSITGYWKRGSPQH